MKNKEKLIKLTTGITALSLTLSLTSCYNNKKKDKFYFYANIHGEKIINKRDYISIDYINNYYILVLYNKILDKKIIYIANRLQYKSGESQYTNVFTNNKIAYDNDEKDHYDFIEVIPLSEFLIEYHLLQEKYTYEDMLNIYDIIKKEYKKKYDNILKKSLTIDINL